MRVESFLAYSGGRVLDEGFDRWFDLDADYATLTGTRASILRGGIGLAFGSRPQRF